MKVALAILSVLALSAGLVSADAGVLTRWNSIVEEKVYRERVAEHQRSVVTSYLRSPPNAELASAVAASLPAESVTRQFDQVLDHYRAGDTRTYKQRYHVNAENWTPKGPVFIFVGGEGELTDRNVLDGHVVELAKKHGGLVVGLEHRYYGESVPDCLENPLSSENIRFLSSQQALSDLAYFIGTAKRTDMFEKEFLAGAEGVTPGTERKWISVGGSYPGSLSAWARSKFPHLIAGSIASSAPVRARANFFEYDQVVGEMVGPECKAAIQKATSEVEGKISGEFMSEIGNCSPNTDPVAFLYVLADMVAFTVQYSNDIDETMPTYHMRENMCHNMTTMGSADAWKGLFEFSQGLLGQTCDQQNMENGVTDLTVKAANNMRQWYYQSCTEFGYFQVAPEKDSVRSRKIDKAWHEALCHKAFGDATNLHIQYTNEHYGADEPAQTNIVFPNGSLDPWHALSVTKPVVGSPLVTPILIEGTSHCTDLKASNDNDPEPLRKARGVIDGLVETWLRDSACPADCNQATGAGFCINGECLCRNGFTGESCQTRVQ